MKYILLLMLFSNALYAQTSMMPNRGNQFNPAMGLNTMMLTQDSQVDTENDGFSLQGIELQFNTDVDAYFRAQIVIGIHREFHEEHEDEEEEEEEEHEGNHFQVHPEEAYIESTAIKNFTFKAGKFLSQFGKYNAIHLHALPFIFRGVVQQEMFGYEGFSSTGMSGSFFLPVNFFSEFTIEALQADNENLFENSNHATAYVAKIKNLWDLNEQSTFELGFSGLTYTRHAYNDIEEEKTDLVGADFTYKWRPLKNGRNQSFMFSTEYIARKRSGEVDSENAGITSFTRFQLAQRWFLQAQYEYLGIDRTEDEEYTHAHSALLGYIPSEFSAIRLQYDIMKLEDQEDEKRISLQFNVSIGAHPAHMY